MFAYFKSFPAAKIVYLKNTTNKGLKQQIVVERYEDKTCKAKFLAHLLPLPDKINIRHTITKFAGEFLCVFAVF